MNNNFLSFSSTQGGAGNFSNTLTPTNANNNNTTSTNPQSLIRSSIDELRLIGVMLRSFAKSKAANDLSISEPQQNSTIQPLSSIVQANQNHHQQAAALANVLEHRFSGSHSDITIAANSTTSHQPQLPTPKNANPNNNNLMGSVAGVHAGETVSREESPAGHHHQNESTNTTTNKNTNNNVASMLLGSSFFPSPGIYQQQQEISNDVMGNPQLLALASKIDAVLQDLKNSLSNLNNKNNSFFGKNVNLSSEGAGELIPTESGMLKNQESSASFLPPITSQQQQAKAKNATKEENNQNNNNTDHRKLFPRSAPGWTRRVEPSVIDKYAKERQEERQQAMIQAKNATTNANTSSARGGTGSGSKNLTSTSKQQSANQQQPRPPLLSSNTVLSAAMGNTSNNNNGAPIASSSKPNTLSAPANFAQQLLANAPTTEMRDSMELQELTQATSASIYMALRACSVMLRAESASVFVYFGGEMICCACIGVGAVFPPCSNRFASGGSLAHAVLTSGVALHRTVRQDVPPPNSSSAGVSQSNSASGAAAFTRVDGRGRRRSLVGGNTTNNNLTSNSSSSTFVPQPPNNNTNSSNSFYPIQDTLMMPIFSPFGGMKNKNIRHATNNNNNGMDDETSNNNNGCRAVLQLQNKNKGTAAFTEVDETKASFYADLIGYFMHLGDTANLDYRTTSYDPIAVQRTIPFIPAKPMPSLNYPTSNVISNSNDGTSTFFGDSAAINKTFMTENQNQNQNNNNNAATKNYISRYFEDFEPRKLIHRNVVDATRQGAEAGSGIARRAVLGQAANEVGPAPSLREIDSYVSNLRDSWRRAVDETVTANAESTTRAQQIRDLKTELEKSRGEATQLSELLQLERFSAGDYVNHYEELRGELEGFLQRRTAGSEELFSWTSQNLIGKKKTTSDQNESNEEGAI